MYTLKRLRTSKAIRDLTAQVNLSIHNLVMPYFVCEGKRVKQPIKAMPGISRFSCDSLLQDVEGAKRLGIHSIILFGIPEKKDEKASGAYQEDGVIQKALTQLKKNFGDELAVITDVCLCEYTSHGHCGIIKKSPQSILRQAQDTSAKDTERSRSAVHSPQIDDNETLKILSKIALSHARAGADIVAPSAMRDGQVAAIRGALDKNGFKDTAIMGYSAKFASSFYGPFREAAGSRMKFGDRKSYQMDFRNCDEALREIKADMEEGADIVMVKPALAYLDIIVKAKEKFNIPVAAYNVSGEYSMVKTYCKSTVHSPQSTEMEKDIALEILTAIKRSGADIIITYWAKDVAKWLAS